MAVVTIILLLQQEAWSEFSCSSRGAEADYAHLQRRLCPGMGQAAPAQCKVCWPNTASACPGSAGQAGGVHQLEIIPDGLLNLSGNLLHKFMKACFPRQTCLRAVQGNHHYLTHLLLRYLLCMHQLLTDNMLTTGISRRSWRPRSAVCGYGNCRHLECGVRFAELLLDARLICDPQDAHS